MSKGSRGKSSTTPSPAQATSVPARRRPFPQSCVPSRDSSLGTARRSVPRHGGGHCPASSGDTAPSSRSLRGAKIRTSQLRAPREGPAPSDGPRVPTMWWPVASVRPAQPRDLEGVCQGGARPRVSLLRGLLRCGASRSGLRGADRPRAFLQLSSPRGGDGRVTCPSARGPRLGSCPPFGDARAAVTPWGLAGRPACRPRPPEAAP